MAPREDEEHLLRVECDPEIVVFLLEIVESDVEVLVRVEQLEHISLSKLWGDLLAFHPSRCTLDLLPRRKPVRIERDDLVLL